MQTQHPQRVKHFYTLIHQRLRDNALLSLCFFQYLFQLLHLLQTALPCNDGSNSILNGCLLLLKIFHLLGYNGEVLIGGKPVDRIKEDSPVVIGYDVGVPSR